MWFFLLSGSFISESDWNENEKGKSIIVARTTLDVQLAASITTWRSHVMYVSVNGISVIFIQKRCYSSLAAGVYGGWKEQCMQKRRKLLGRHFRLLMDFIAFFLNPVWPTNKELGKISMRIHFLAKVFFIVLQICNSGSYKVKRKSEIWRRVSTYRTCVTKFRWPARARTHIASIFIESRFVFDARFARAHPLIKHLFPVSPSHLPVCHICWHPPIYGLLAAKTDHSIRRRHSDKSSVSTFSWFIGAFSRSLPSNIGSHRFSSFQLCSVSRFFQCNPSITLGNQYLLKD